MNPDAIFGHVSFFDKVLFDFQEAFHDAFVQKSVGLSKSTVIKRDWESMWKTCNDKWLGGGE